MNAVVVYESHWGNTAAVAKAIADGLGDGARSLSTAEATPDAMIGVDLIVAGAPVIAFAVPSEKTHDNIAGQTKKGPTPDLAHPSMREWLQSLPEGSGGSAAFETRLRFSPGGATKEIIRGLERLGYRSVGEPQRYFVKGQYGPLREGELDRARAWGAELAQARIPQLAMR